MLCLKIRFRFFEKSKIICRKTMVLFGMMDFCPPALGKEYGKTLATIHNSTIPDLIFQAECQMLSFQ